MNEMKTELLDIIRKKYSGENQRSEILGFAEKLIDSLELRKEQTKNVFLKFLNKYNFETIKNFSEYPEYPNVTLFKGVGNWTLCPVIDYEGGVTDMDEEIGILFTDPEIYIQEEDLSEIGWELTSRIILTWLSLIWQEIDGNSFGIVVKTLENNSCSSFYFNDLAWDNLSDVRSYNTKDKRLNVDFPAKLDIISIFQRVCLITYPVYPYFNKWRFFKKGDEVIEFVSYGNETGEKLSKDSISDIKIIEHKTLFDTLKHELKRSLELISWGYVEYLTETRCNTPIYEGAIETRFHSGEHWYANEQKSRLDLNKIYDLEKTFNVSFPFHFKHYLRLFNGRKYNNINLNFNIGDDYLNVKEFYDFTEIEWYLKTQRKQNLFEKIEGLFRKVSDELVWIEIAITNADDKLLLNLQNSLVGLKSKEGNVKELYIDFENFIYKPVNYYSASSAESSTSKR